MRDFVAALRGLTLRGRSFLAAGVACGISAAVLGEQDLLRIGVLLIAMPVLAAAVVCRTRYRLSCSRRLQPRRVTAGDRVSVRIQLENVSRSPSSVLFVEDAVDVGLSGGARFVLGRIEPGGRRDVSYSMRAISRGRYQIGPMATRLGDPFGLCELSRSFRSIDELIVAPAIERLPAIRARGTASPSADQQRSTGTGQDESTTRPYRSGDDLRRVHWKTTARVGELMVRREEQPRTSSAVILLDTRAAAWPAEAGAAAFEWAVSAVGAIGMHLARSGYQVRLLTDRGPAATIDRGTAANLLDELSTLTPVPTDTLRPAFTALRQPTGADRGCLVVAVLGRPEPALVASLAGLRSPGAPTIALIADAAGWTPGAQDTSAELAAARGTLSRAGWAVLPAVAGTSLAAMWPRLIGLAGRGGTATSHATTSRPRPTGQASPPASPTPNGRQGSNGHAGPNDHAGPNGRANPNGDTNPFGYAYPNGHAHPNGYPDPGNGASLRSHTGSHDDGGPSGSWAATRSHGPQVHPYTPGWPGTDGRPGASGRASADGWPGAETPSDDNGSAVAGQGAGEPKRGAR